MDSDPGPGHDARRGLSMVRALVVGIPSVYVGCKVTLTVLGGWIPGQPYFGFTVAQWFRWSLLEPNDWILVLMWAPVLGALSWRWLRRVDLVGVVIWSVSLGAYLAGLEVFNWTKWFPPLVVSAPIVIAWVLAGSRRWRNPRP